MPNKILVRGANWVGDAVMTLPALYALAGNFPGANITLLTRPWAAPVYEHQPLLGEVLRHDKDGRHQGFLGRLRLARELAAQKFTAAYLFQNAFEAALISFLARIPKRAGFARDGRAFLLTDPVALRESDRYIHESFYYLEILERLGLEAPFSRPAITPKAEALLKADKILAEGRAQGFLLALAPGAAFGAAKRWPVKNFAEAAKIVLERNPGTALILGGGGESDAAGELSELLGSLPHINLAGRASLDVAVALMSRAQLLITNDSGLMHIGGAVGLPLAAPFGPTNPLTTAPLGRSRLLRSSAPCSPCLKRECPLPGGRICFDELGPEALASAALDLISPPVARAGAKGAVFLDRDGTINREVGYLSSPERLELLPGAGEAIRALNRAGIPVVVTTNQAGVARGYFTEETLAAIHRRLAELLAGEGATLDAVYYCPHHLEGVRPELAIACDCRKPGSGMAERAARELNLDLASSVWVGDRPHDLAPAEKFGGRSVLVMTGYGLDEAKKFMAGDGTNAARGKPTLAAPDLKRAVQWILS